LKKSVFVPSLPIMSLLSPGFLKLSFISFTVFLFKNCRVFLP
jgi:hypothetical protein